MSSGAVVEDFVASFVKFAKKFALLARVRSVAVCAVVFSPLCAGTLNVCRCKEGPREPVSPLAPVNP